MLAISMLLGAHLIHVRCSVLRVLLTVGVGVAIWVASLRTLALVHLLGRLGLLTRNCRIRGIVATILRFLLAISWLRPTGGILALCVLSGGSKRTTRALLDILTLTVPTIVILVSSLIDITLLSCAVIGGIIARGRGNLLRLVGCLIGEGFLGLYRGQRRRLGLLYVLLSERIVCFLTALSVTSKLVGVSIRLLW